MLDEREMQYLYKMVIPSTSGYEQLRAAAHPGRGARRFGNYIIRTPHQGGVLRIRSRRDRVAADRDLKVEDTVPGIKGRPRARRSSRRRSKPVLWSSPAIRDTGDVIP